ncbi:DUF3820 family protein [Parathalassolituus penaei]|uniref:DUF3820 family protein n=1 Tax=Parathalassolituus penaei TaxID=2997323 RepID=A0A9X3EBJ5_9GAMM|nr:DUF3820 family protein [Parathalassolituus penaei]MCY0964151.1 DUF3820 family protein [Parathalassolituus penaei]
MFDKTDLVRLISVTMPFGKFQGRVIMDLPEEYLLWFRHKGFPDGELGQLMALALEIRINGLEDILTPLRASTQPQTTNRH